MLNFLKRIFKFSVFFKTLTIICLIFLILSYCAPYVHPNTFWMFPFFGLSYPVIMICTLILLIIWAIARSKWFFVVLFFILLGGKLHFRIYSPGFGKNDEKSKNSVKLLSYNVKNFDVYNLGFNKECSKRDSIFKFLGNFQADIICFQEFYSKDEKNKVSMKDTLHKLLNSKYFHNRMTFNKRHKKYFGVAMYSKYPMVTKGFIQLDESNKNSNNFCIFADIVKGKDTFRIYNTHFQSLKFQADEYALFGQKEYTGNLESGVKTMIKKINIGYQKRAGQVEKVIKHMEQSPYEVLICGDFNDTPMSYVYNQFYSKYVDAFRNSSSGFGITYAGKVPAGRIDYIFHSKNISSTNFNVQKDVFSDHKAISCEFWKK